MIGRIRAIQILLLVLIMQVGTGQVCADTIGDLVRIRGMQQNGLMGLGLVIGLPGTGDSGEELITARPLFEVLRRMGNMPGSFDDLAESRAVALVMVKCTVPEGGARAGDLLDVRVSTLGSASSLAGGELFMAPLRYEIRGVVEGDAPLAIAQGTIVIDDQAAPTNATVPGGARMWRDLAMGRLGRTFELIIDRHFAGHRSAVTIAQLINQEWHANPDQSLPSVATAIDDRVIRIDVPPEQLGAIPGFVSEILSYALDIRTLGLPARVIVNRRTGVIIVTGTVRIAPVVITHKDLTITTALPEPVPTPEQPIVRLENWAGVSTQAREAETARLSDLLAAMERLDVPVEDQIDVLLSLRKSGHLQAEVIIE
ncbi:MAG: flagellar basal body P-ring protein FlgI [Planctomycetota bacterium]